VVGLRAVLIDTRGRTVPMDNWTRDGLWASNNLATEIAKELSCPVYDRRKTAASSCAAAPMD
jgi:hypothetical protein